MAKKDKSKKGHAKPLSPLPPEEARIEKTKRKNAVVSKSDHPEAARFQPPSEIYDAHLKHLFERIAAFEEDEPFKVLGPHNLPSRSGVVIRSFLPRAQQAWILRDGTAGETVPMAKVHTGGLYEAVFEGVKDIFPYQLAWQDRDGRRQEQKDPYAYSIFLTDFDLHLLGEGNHFKSYEKLGAHLAVMNGAAGVHFTVWAPNAKSLSVVGDFNHWCPAAHPLARIRHSGFWALFIPGLQEGALYKFAVRGCDGMVRMKTDPYARDTELRPRTASRVSSDLSYEWTDRKWLEERAKRNPLVEPVSIYEVHLGSWRRKGENGSQFLSYREAAHSLVDYVKNMGYTHIEFLPLMEHPLDESWGYQVVNFFAPTSRFGRPEDFKYLVNHCHENGIGVLLDWVPGHFPTDGHGLANFDGREIYAYDDWKKREHKEWGTFVFDYGRREVRNFLISSALYWLDEFHVDGLRVDAVASMLYLDYSRKEGEWEPNEFGGKENPQFIRFIKFLNEILYRDHPGIMMIAEESTAWPGVSRPTYAGGLGFGFKWNMGWMNDTLEYFSKDSVHRSWHQNMLTFSLLYAFSENFILPVSHDEVVHGKASLIGKMPGDDWQKFANVRLFLGFMFTHPGKKLLFMGQDFAQWDEWNSRRSLDWHLLAYERHQHIQKWVRDLNLLYRSSPALFEVDFEPSGFEWIDFSDHVSSLISFVRWSRDWKDCFVIVCNMTPVPRLDYRIGVPREGCYRELLNSDSEFYGGSGMGNLGGKHAERMSAHGRPFSLNLNLPPLGILIFKHER